MSSELELARFKQELEKAIGVFKNIVAEPMQEYLRNPSQITMGQEKIYAHLGGILTYSCSSREEFCKFIQAFFEFETCTEKYGIVQEGLVFKHQNNGYERKILRPYFGDLNFEDVLDYNINYNPVVIRLCLAIKQGLAQSGINEAICNYRRCSDEIERMNDRTRPRADVITPRSGRKLPPPGFKL